MSAAGLETADARLVVERVASGLSLADVARHLSDEPALAAFAGCWGALGAVIANESVELLVDDGDPFAALDRLMPVVDRTTGAVGGGWMGYLGCGVGTWGPGPVAATARALFDEDRATHLVPARPEAPLAVGRPAI